MKTVAVVPVKKLSEAKSRLAGVLSPEERSALALDLLRHVLDAIAASGVVDSVAVISPEPGALGLPPGVVRLAQARGGLNHVFYQGRAWAAAKGADALLAVLADLPLLRPGDISAMAELAGAPNTVVLAPDRHGVGTNAMLVHPLSRARFKFGTRSFPLHRSVYAEADILVKTYTSPGTSLDLDTPDDLAFLAEYGVGLDFAQAITGSVQPAIGG